ncbi:PREDICTED: uncharacterized protein LOC101302290 [Fragaria vesca subsp. vesca]
MLVNGADEKPDSNLRQRNRARNDQSNSYTVISQFVARRPRLRLGRQEEPEVFYECLEEFELSNLEILKNEVELDKQWVAISIRAIKARFEEDEELSRIVLQRTIRVLDHLFYLASEMLIEFKFSMGESAASRNALLLENSEVVRVLDRSVDDWKELIFLPTEDTEPIDILKKCLCVLRRAAVSSGQLLQIMESNKILPTLA